MWYEYWFIFLSSLEVLRYTEGQQELNDINFGCRSGSYRHGNFCYFTSSILETYDDAESLCQMAGGLLAPIMDRDTQHFLHTLYIRTYLQNYWIGLNDRDHEGQWIYSDNTLLSGFTKWTKDEPNNLGGNQHCVKMWMARNLEWDDANCNKKKLYICEYNAYKCGRGLPKHGDSCYELSKELASYDDANKNCHYRDGRLPVVKSEDTHNFLKKLILAERFWLNMSKQQMQSALQYLNENRPWLGNVWFGLRYINGEWKQSDGKPVVFMNWVHGVPNIEYNEESCAALNPFWSYVGCDNKYSFVCRIPVEVDSTSLLSKADCTSKTDSSALHEIRLGVGGFVIVLLTCAILGIVIIIGAYLAILKIRQCYNVPRSPRDDQDLEVLNEPET